MLVRGVPIVAATNTENGVIYVLNKVLTEETSSASVLEEIQLRPELSTFYNYLQRTPLISKLQGRVADTLFEVYLVLILFHLVTKTFLYHPLISSSF